MKLPLKIGKKWILARNKEGKLEIREIVRKSEDKEKWEMIKRIFKSI